MPITLSALPSRDIPMLVGLMDHWVPSHDNVSHFWRTPFDEAAPAMAELCDEIAINHFTFYTKWMSNGLRSSLPVLRNEPRARNVITNNAWGRQWIDFLHARNISVGAMIQCYWWDAGMLPREAVLRHRPLTKWCTGYETGSDVVDPLWPGHDDILRAVLREQLEQFPKLDAIWLEFEGVSGNLEDRPLCRMSVGQSIAPVLEEQLRATNWLVKPEHRWVWTRPVQAALADALKRRLAVVEQTLDELGFRGKRGVVYHAMGFEAPFVAQSLPSKKWWLLPWHYWGWAETITEDDRDRQIAWCLGEWKRMKNEGYPICYIGNATLPTPWIHTIDELARATIDLGLAGHLGMGNPIPKIGLRWDDATEESVKEAREIYRRVWPGTKRQ